jgi:hypothetical protein
VLRKVPASRKLEATEIVEAIDKDLGPHALTSLDGAEFVPPIDPANPNTQSANKLYRKVRYTWKVIPPAVPPQASLVRDSGTALPLYKRPNGELFVVVSKWEDVEKAKPIALAKRAKIVAQRRT